MQRAVLFRPANVRFTVEDDTGVLADLDTPPDPGCLVQDMNEDEVATGDAILDVSPGEYRFPFAPTVLGVHQAFLDGTLDGVSYSTREKIRVVDRRAVPLSRLRADSALADLSASAFLQAVSAAEDTMEHALRFRVVKTMDRVVVRLTQPQRVLRLPGGGPFYIHAVNAGTFNGAYFDVSEIVSRGDALEKSGPGSWDFLTGGSPTGVFLPGEYMFDLEHGMLETPGDIQHAISILARHYAPLTAQDNAYPDRASKIVSADTEIWFARRGPDTWTGIPEVDDVIGAHRLHVPIADNSTF